MLVVFILKMFYDHRIICRQNCAQIGSTYMPGILILMYACAILLTSSTSTITFYHFLRCIFFIFKFLHKKSWCMTVSKNCLRTFISHLRLLKKMANWPERLQFFYFCLSNRSLPKNKWKYRVFTRTSADNQLHQRCIKFTHEPFNVITSG